MFGVANCYPKQEEIWQFGYFHRNRCGIYGFRSLTTINPGVHAAGFLGSTGKKIARSMFGSRSNNHQ